MSTIRGGAMDGIAWKIEDNDHGTLHVYAGRPGDESYTEIGTIDGWPGDYTARGKRFDLPKCNSVPEAVELLIRWWLEEAPR